MDRVLVLCEKAILYVLVALMTIVLFLATLDLIWTIGVAVSRRPFLVVTLEALLDIFGMFLLVLVGLELLDTIKAYVKEHVVHAEIVLLAAMIAVARKAITLDLQQVAPEVALGLSALLLALAAGYFLLKRAGLATAPARGG